MISTSASTVPSGISCTFFSAIDAICITQSLLWALKSFVTGRHVNEIDGVSNCQIASLIKVSILNAAYRESDRTSEGAHRGRAAVEVEVTRIGTANRTTPIAAVGTYIVDRTIALEAESRHGQL